MDMENIMKYFLQGVAVAFVAFCVLPGGACSVRTVLTLGISAAIVMFVLDTYAPIVGESLRKGIGFGLGAQMVGGL